MRNIHVYIDGSWLFSQCGREAVLTKKTVHDNTRIDYAKLVESMKKSICEWEGLPGLDTGKLHYYISVIITPQRDTITYKGKVYNLQGMKKNSYSRSRIVQAASDADFRVVKFEVDFRPWMPKAIYDTKSYQEKMVDTALVTQLITNLLNPEYKEDYHAVITGDIDIFPGIDRVVGRHVMNQLVLFTIDPEQFDPDDAQVSHELTTLGFRVGPFYLENFVEGFLEGNFVGRCQYCGLIFSAHESQKFCPAHNEERKRLYGGKLNRSPRHKMVIVDPNEK